MAQAARARGTLRPAAVGLALGVLLASPTAAASDSDPWFGKDKLLHFSVSAGLAASGYALSAPLTESYEARVAIGSAVALTAGITKEVYDLTGAGSASLRDLTWDLAGTIVGVGLALLTDYLIRGDIERSDTRQSTAASLPSPSALRLTF